MVCFIGRLLAYWLFNETLHFPTYHPMYSFSIPACQRAIAGHRADFGKLILLTLVIPSWPLPSGLPSPSPPSTDMCATRSQHLRSSTNSLHDARDEDSNGRTQKNIQSGIFLFLTFFFWFCLRKDNLLNLLFNFLGIGYGIHLARRPLDSRPQHFWTAATHEGWEYRLWFWNNCLSTC